MANYPIAFQWVVQHTLEVEGFFSDHPSDGGRKTKFGITEGLARDYGYDDVSKLTVSQAKDIYYREFWVKIGLQEVAETSWRVAAEVFDTAVNTGHYRAAKIAQQALSEIFLQSLSIDGILGPNTRGALIKVAERYEQHLVAALNGYQFSWYLWLLRNGKAGARSFIKGWMKRLETPLPPIREDD